MKRLALFSGVALGGMLILACPPPPEEDAGPEDKKDAGGSSSDAAHGTDAAGGHDAAGTDAAQAGCGDITIQGTCDGTVLSYCYADELQSFDCANNGLNCGLLDCTDNEDCWGYDCLVAAGGDCNAFFDLDGDGYLDPVWCDEANGYGCIDQSCAMSESCEKAGEGESAFNCSDDNTSIEFCLWTTIATIDCTSAGNYQCGENSAGSVDCMGLEGADCSSMECAEGFECNAGLCEAVAAEDAGVVVVEDGGVVVVEDGGVVVVEDGGTVVTDATMPASDATMPASDATMPAADATMPAADATMPAADATMPEADATVTEPDAG